LPAEGATLDLDPRYGIGTTEYMRSVGGWDAYNVTEDADLGLRLARGGHRVAPLDSTTFEETNGRLSYWALAHPPGKPDFHHPDCFALELPAA